MKFHRGLCVALLASFVSACWAPAQAQVAPAADYLGMLGDPFGTIVLDTRNSGFDTQLALYDSSGNLLQLNDDFDFGTGGVQRQSRIEISSLTSGRYYVAVAGFSTQFAVGFGVSPGAASGSFSLNYSNVGQFTAGVNGTLASGSVEWYSFDLINVLLPETGVFDLGTIARPGEGFTVSTFGSSVAATVSLVSGMGTLQDASSPAGGATNLIATGPLSEQTYAIVVGPQGAFATGRGVMTFWDDADEGTVSIRLGDRAIIDWDLGPNRPLILRFDVEPVCALPTLAASTQFENEPLYSPLFGGVDTTNGGCAGTPDTATLATINQTWRGTVSKALIYSDTQGSAFVGDDDYYELLLPSEMVITAQTPDNADLRLSIIEIPPFVSDCTEAQELVVSSAVVSPPAFDCDEVFPPSSSTQVEATVGPGRVFVRVAANGAETLVQNIDYELRLSGRPALISRFFDAGRVGDSADLVSIDASGQFDPALDTELALFDDQGKLLFSNDDVDGANDRSSALPTQHYPGGYYFAVASGYNVAFGDGFVVDPRVDVDGLTVSGSVDLTIGAPGFVFSAGVPLGNNEAFWLRFGIGCSIADVADTLGLIDVADVLAAIDGVNNQDVDFDIALPLGNDAYDFFDMLVFFNGAQAGCP